MTKVYIRDGLLCKFHSTIKMLDCTGTQLCIDNAELEPDEQLSNQNFIIIGSLASMRHCRNVPVS